ncbi:MAG: anti-sigma factor antagonist [Candidatus Krumholzibacteriota bacterium]|nr:anti-sigma factor antagonist [Candidatus Krumholzibacteriota bacterium]
MNDKEIFRLKIPAEENNLGEVRDFVADICVRAGFSKRETNNTKLAMDEACTNIIKHAYKDSAGQIEIEVTAEYGKLEITVLDQGKAFEWSKIKDPDLQRYVEIGKKGGLGVFLMNRLMDGLDYQSTEAGNRLLMTKTSAHAVPGEGFKLFRSIKPRGIATLRFKFAMRATAGLLGLVLFLWGMLIIQQTREIRDLRNHAWLNMSSLARTLESKSENALVIDDLFHPEYREINDFIQERILSFTEVKYVRVINSGGIVVSSSSFDEIQEKYVGDSELNDIPPDGRWVDKSGTDQGDIQEFYYPVSIREMENDRIVRMGVVILGISRTIVDDSIYDSRPKTTLILLGIFLVGLALIYLLISVLVKPIQALTDGVRAIGEGALKDGIHIDGPEEIGAIAEAFNEITSKFRAAQESVVEQERMQKEMQVAQEIQHSLLPGKVPEIKGYDIASLYRAAKEVGGDYYDFVKVGEDSLGVVVADVSGKGVPGSLVMTMIRTALRMEARGNFSAAEVMARMNDFVTEDMKKGMFVTIFYVILDSRNRVISYASAGHNPMILFRAETDETFFLNPRGFPVGISLPDDTLFRRSIDVEKIKLKKDDMLVIYTDGVTEAMNEDREQYGEDRLINLIKSSGKLSPDEFIDKLNGDIWTFTGEYPQNDDITVVAIKEKMMADDVLSGIRKKLLDLVDVKGMSVADACSMMKVSPSTYYRYRKRLAEMGERGLKNKSLRTEHEIKRVSLEQRKELLDIVIANPNFGAKRISDEFNRGKEEKYSLKPSLIYDELKRMRLNTYEKRIEYLRRNKVITEIEYQEMLAAPAFKLGKPWKKEDESELPEIGMVPGLAADGTGATGSEVSVSGEQADTGEFKEKIIEQVPPEEKIAISEDAGEAVTSGGSRGLLRTGDESLEKLFADVIRDSEEGGMLSIDAASIGDGVVILKVKGHLDSSSASDLENVLERTYESGINKIIVNLGEVSYISSGGWGIFTGRVKALREGKGDVVLTSMSPEVFDIYELLGFQDVIEHFQTVEEAVEFISLPFEKRQMDLEERTSRRKKDKTLEHRVAVTSEERLDSTEGSAWTPLAIEAGTVGQRGEITVLNLTGVVDTVSCLRLRDVLNDLLDNGSVKLVIDMSKVEYVSSAGWGIFASRIDELRSRGGDMKIFGMDPEVDGIFHMLGFDVIIRSFGIFSEALDDFDEPELSGQTSGSEDSPDGGNEAAEMEVVEDSSALRDDLALVVSHIESVEGRPVILRIDGAVDASTTGLFERYLEESIEEDSGHLVIDMSGLIYMSSSGWGTIIKYMQRLEKNSGKLVLAGMNPSILRIFQDLGLEPLISHHLTVEKAVEGFRALPPGEEGDDPAAVKAGMPAAPLIEKIELPPIIPLKESALPELESVYDLEDIEKETEIDDKRIKDLGWTEYGEKLSRHNRNKRKKGK